MDEIEKLVSEAGGTGSGILQTGSFVTITEPVTQSTAITPLTGISAASVEEDLARVRRRFAGRTMHDGLGRSERR